MVENSFVWFLGAGGVFYFLALASLLFGFDTAQGNLLAAMVLALIFNANDVSGIRLKTLWLLCAFFFVLTFFISARIWGVWLFILFLFALSVFKDDYSKESLGKILVFAAAFFNLSFVTNTGLQDVQHDFASCFNYIEYVLENNFLFWQENPLLSRPSYSSYHPVLHFFLAAIYFKCGMFLGLSQNMAAEAAQVMFCFYMFGYYLLAAKILARLNLGRTAYLAGLGFVIFFPAYNAIAGFFNNDCLLLPLQAGAVYFALCYYQDGGKKNLGFIFLFVTAAALTKLSGVLVLPAVGIMVLLRLLEKKNKQTFIEALLLGLSVLAGIMIWPLYQYFVLHLPFDYVPALSQLSLSRYSMLERFNPIKGLFYEDMFYHNFEINLWETLTKTALFGEWNLSFKARDIFFLFPVMILLYKLILVCSVFFSIFLAFLGKNKKEFIFFAALVVSLLIGEVMFVLKHPFMCNQDFRYIALLPLGLAGILALGAQQLKIEKIVFAGVLVFSICAAMIWWRVSL